VSISPRPPAYRAKNEQVEISTRAFSQGRYQAPRQWTTGSRAWRGAGTAGRDSRPAPKERGTNAKCSAKCSTILRRAPAQSLPTEPGAKCSAMPVLPARDCANRPTYCSANLLFRQSETASAAAADARRGDSRSILPLSSASPTRSLPPGHGTSGRASSPRAPGPGPQDDDTVGRDSWRTAQPEPGEDMAWAKPNTRAN
jgi:hypothetical protein